MHLKPKKTCENVKTEQLVPQNTETEPDYYIENGFYVFTEAFLRKRGYCCSNGCRHCPYGFKKLKQTE